MKQCRWKQEYCHEEVCKRHAPIVIANLNFKDTDRRTRLTEFPEAKCPCGDYDVEITAEELWDTEI